MKFEWDEAKNAINVEKHGWSFADAHEIFEGDRLVFPDQRTDYGEARFVLMGVLRERVVVAVFTERPARTIRMISLRKASKREKERFEKALAERPDED